MPSPKPGPTVEYTLEVRVTRPLDEDYTVLDAAQVGVKRELERSLFTVLKRWDEDYDVELMDVTFHNLPEPEHTRDKGDDDGVEYSHPGDYRKGLE